MSRKLLELGGLRTTEGLSTAHVVRQEEVLSAGRRMRCQVYAKSWEGTVYLSICCVSAERATLIDRRFLHLQLAANQQPDFGHLHPLPYSAYAAHSLGPLVVAPFLIFPLFFSHSFFHFQWWVTYPYGELSDQRTFGESSQSRQMSNDTMPPKSMEKLRPGSRTRLQRVGTTLFKTDLLPSFLIPCSKTFPLDIW